MTRKERRQIFRELEEFVRNSGNRYAYRFEKHGDGLVELRYDRSAGRTVTPVDARGVATGPSKRPLF